MTFFLRARTHGYQAKGRAPFHYLLMGLLFITLIACSKEDTANPDPDPPPDTDSAGISVPYYQLQRVENLNAATDDENPTVPKSEILFSLKYKKEQPLSYAKTNRWDISFSGLYNSFLSGNNKSDQNNTGYQGPAIGGIAIVAKAFEDVIDIPADASFSTGKGLIGTDDAGFFGQGTGWYLYDFGGTLAGDGSYDKQHVAYALGDSLHLSNNTTMGPRTIIVKTAAGDYAKLKMVSCYKDAFSAHQWFRNTPHMYFTFEYVMVPAGSTKFETR
jgi:hypothetical protein